MNKWARDLLSLKKLLCGLPKKIGMRPEEYADFFKMVPKMRRYLRHDGLKWVSPFFRPDCILTDTGPKVLEFNIDTGSMAFISGISLKLLYSIVPGLPEYLTHDLKTGFDKSFWAEDIFTAYLKNIGKKKRNLYLWDIKDRDSEGTKERSFEIDYFRDKGVKIELLVAGDILTKLSPEAYCFRYFAYLHFFTPSSALENLFLNIPSGLIDKNDISISSLLYDNKINLALLWDPRIQKYLDPGERALVSEYIPETYLSSEVSKDFIRRALKDKDLWVIKKGIGRQGKNVHIGRDYSSHDWRTIVMEAVEAKDYVFQKLVKATTLPSELTDGKNMFTASGGHILNFHYVNNTFGGMLFRATCRKTGSKIGAIDSSEVAGVMPLILDF